IGDAPRDGGGRRGERARQEGPAALALAAFEVAVAGADGVLPGLELIAVHGDAHRAARLAPLRARVAEDAIEPFRLRLALHPHGAWNHQHAHVAGALAAAQEARG